MGRERTGRPEFWAEQNSYIRHDTRQQNMLSCVASCVGLRSQSNEAEISLTLSNGNNSEPPQNGDQNHRRTTDSHSHSEHFYPTIQLFDHSRPSSPFSQPTCCLKLPRSKQSAAENPPPPGLPQNGCHSVFKNYRAPGMDETASCWHSYG